MKVIVIDANLTILLVVGLTHPNYISRHKRCQEFDIQAFELLKGVIARSKEIVVTPNTLTEASNLLRYIAEPAKSEIGRTFQRFIERTREVYIKSVDGSLNDQFLSLGLTDTALLQVAQQDVAILSVDFDLCIAGEIAGYAVINFNHIRDAAYGYN